MRFNLGILQSLAITLTTLLLAGAAMATTTKTNATKPPSTSHKSVTPSKSGKSASSKSKKKKSVSAKATSHGQHGIDQERTRQIQEALIRDHYMTGEPTGSWDQATKDALTRYQEENGWQTKSVPDSRALIKLGLGPDKKGLLNPDTAVMSSPHELGSQQGTLPGGSAQQ